MVKVIVILISLLVLPVSSTVHLGDSKIFSEVKYSSPLHLEIDQSDPSRLLASFYSSLGYITKDGSNPYAIVGNGNSGYRDGFGNEAKFKTIKGFRQVNDTHVLLADYDNYCLRLVNKVTRQATTAAGVCEDWEYVDGPLRTAQFYRPVNIIDGFTEGSFLVTDHHNCAIRDVNLNTGVVSTFRRDMEKIYFPIDMAYDEKSSRLYVTLRFKVIYIDKDTLEVELLFHDEPDKIILFRPNVLWISKNPEVGSNITQIEVPVHGSHPNLTALLDTRWRGGSPQALLLNSSSNLYVADRRVVRSVRIEEGELPPTTPKPATITKRTTVTAVTEKSTIKRIPKLTTAKAENTLPTTTQLTGIIENDGEQTTSISLAIGVASCTTVILLIALAVAAFLRCRLKKRQSTRGKITTIDVDNRRNEVYEWLNKNDIDSHPYDTVSFDDDSAYIEMGSMRRPGSDEGNPIHPIDDERSSLVSWVDVSTSNQPTEKQQRTKDKKVKKNYHNTFTPKVTVQAVQPTEDASVADADEGYSLSTPPDVTTEENDILLMSANTNYMSAGVDAVH